MTVSELWQWNEHGVGVYPGFAVVTPAIADMIADWRAMREHIETSAEIATESTAQAARYILDHLRLQP